MTFEEWKQTGKDVADLRDHADVTQYYPEDHAEPCPGRIYEPGHMERLASGRWWMCISNWDGIIATLEEAERLLWDLYAEAEVTYGTAGDPECRHCGGRDHYTRHCIQQGESA